jgi:hypothetical protein
MRSAASRVSASPITPGISLSCLIAKTTNRLNLISGIMPLFPPSAVRRLPRGLPKSIRPCGDCKCGVKLAEYHVGAHLLLCLADAEIRTGAAASQRGSFQPSLLSLKCRSESWDSRAKLMPLRISYETGANATGTGATYQSGCSTSGKSR